jgi:PTH1 family peptidyl-tRNA hydrolase
MNHSGKSVSAVCKFYKIQPENMLVAYDEIDFDVGVTRFKEGGGHGGHNGVRDIINSIGGKRGFFRLRIGVGHPGHKSMVANYVLSDPSRSEAAIIMSNIEDAIRIIPRTIEGSWEEAMRFLHSDQG